MPETPDDPALADALEALADGVRDCPAMPTDEAEIMLVRAAAARLRELEAENARLRSIVVDVCEPPDMDAQSWADLNMRMMRDAMEGPGPAGPLEKGPP